MMKIFGKEKIVVLVCSLFVFFNSIYITAQTVNNYSIKTWWGPSAPPFSPVINADKSVTFRIKAPRASEVSISIGEWDVKPLFLTKDTTGVWSVTVYNMKPGITAYIFNVDGVQVPDWYNPLVKTGTQLYSSIVEVPSDSLNFDAIQNVEHGTLTIHKYISSSLNVMRNLYVYLPPQYYTHPQQSFPVLYLRHGGGDNESSWTQISGSANIILDNLIARHKAVPMIIVMPNGLTDGSWAGGSNKEGMKLLEDELLKDVIPLVEKTYRVAKGASNRAIAGLSMGGGQSFVMGLHNTDKFSWIGEFSAGLLSDKDLNLDDLLPGVFSSPNEFNKKVKLLWIGCGDKDPRFIGHQLLVSTLNSRKIKNEFHVSSGGHEWGVWREQLYGFMQKIFIYSNK